MLLFKKTTNGTQDSEDVDGLSDTNLAIIRETRRSYTATRDIPRQSLFFRTCCGYMQQTAVVWAPLF
jgi:hypothetical protein